MAGKSTTTKTASRSTGSKSAGKSAERKTSAKASEKSSASKSASKPAKKKTRFSLSAPQASQVNIAGCFNDWDASADQMSPGDDGTWTCTLMLEPGEHEYRFIVDGIWCDDPMAQARRPNEYGCENCVVIV